jgi:hypothetical protein
LPVAKVGGGGAWTCLGFGRTSRIGVELIVRVVDGPAAALYPVCLDSLELAGPVKGRNRVGIALDIAVVCMK